jgi:sugar lactone lactonase YvrE
VNEKAYCIAADESGGLYLGMIDHIEVYDQKGIRKSQWESPGDESIITSIAVSKEFVFVADAGYQTVWKYDRNGSVLRQIGEEDKDKDIPGYIGPSPFFDVCIDPDGFLWVANTGLHSLENYTFDGDLRSSWGEYSMEVEGFCGCCNPTHISILEDGKFVTSEKGIARVKVYNRLGELVSVVAGPDQFVDGTEGLDLAIDSIGRIYIVDPKKKAVRIFEKNVE